MRLTSKMAIVHGIADCRDCDWHDGSTKAQTRGKTHSEKTGHFVSVEIGLAQQYVAGKTQLN